MIEAIKFLRLAWDAYRKAKTSGRPYYSAVICHGVPKVCVFVGFGREAWRITQRALEDQTLEDSRWEKIG